MSFVSNHDKNAWDGTQHEQFGECLEAAIVLSVLGEGMPLIHNGQEAGENKRLAFFERDPIDWQTHPIGDLYRKLIHLKRGVPALWNGEFGARMIQVPNSAPQQVLSFVRMKDNVKVFVVLNLSAAPADVDFYESLYRDEYIDVFAEACTKITRTDNLQLSPWSFRVFVSANFPLI